MWALDLKALFFSFQNGQTLLMIAAQHGQTAIVNELLAQGADVNAEDLVSI